MTSLDRVTEAIWRLPVYLVTGFGLPLLEAIFTDPVITMLTLGSIALGFATNFVWAATAFCFVYVLLRTINSIANAFGHTGVMLTKEIYHFTVYLKELADKISPST